MEQKRFSASCERDFGGGFSLVLDPYTVSVAFNKMTKSFDLDQSQSFTVQSDFAEVMVWETEAGIPVLFDGANDSQPCHSFLSPIEVLSILNRASLNRF